MAGNQVEHATQLSQALEKVSKSVSDSFFRSRQRPQHNLKPGDYVVVKRVWSLATMVFPSPADQCHVCEAKGKSARFHAYYCKLTYSSC
ncbi:hypothetical protein GDO81_022618 [Engystomops pustulosus]|uniref:Uncharacterized protein n=1 Tax=Engystomops pustulosus TaxID=76066 RepID=A0AAV6YQV8_ENGPU|nr:hypothetical protein GDO81_022618 [Engystomops pustulosus]